MAPPTKNSYGSGKRATLTADQFVLRLGDFVVLPVHTWSLYFFYFLFLFFLGKHYIFNITGRSRR